MPSAADLSRQRLSYQKGMTACTVARRANAQGSTVKGTAAYATHHTSKCNVLLPARMPYEDPFVNQTARNETVTVNDPRLMEFPWGDDIQIDDRVTVGSATYKILNVIADLPDQPVLLARGQLL